MTDPSDFFMDDRAPEQPAERKTKRIEPLDAGLPASLDGERTILGASLLENKAFTEAAEKLDKEDFSLSSHQVIFQRMTDIMEAGRALDLVTLANELAKHKEIEAVGGVSFLASLTEGLPRRPAIGEYVRIVKDRSLLRQLMLISEAAIARAADQSEAAIDVGLSLASQLQDALTDGIGSTLERAGEFLSNKFSTARAMTEATAKMQGVNTGFREFDEMTCGLQKGELIIVGARPSMGKTAWATKISEYSAIDNGLTVGFFSLEMSKESLLRRMICSRARVPFQDHRNGTMSPNMMEEFEWVYGEFDKANLFIDDKPKTALKIAAECRALKAREGLDLVVVDYLGLFHHEESRRQRNQTQEVGMDALLMKDLAKELGIPVVVLVQLSRDLTKRTDKRPVLSDLRDSGNLEEHADLVAFLHREGYYDPKDDNLKNKGENLISKQRNGPVGTCHVAWDGTITRWSDVVDARDFQGTGKDWWNR